MRDGLKFLHGFTKLGGCYDLHVTQNCPMEFRVHLIVEWGGGGGMGKGRQCVCVIPEISLDFFWPLISHVEIVGNGLFSKVP